MIGYYKGEPSEYVFRYTRGRLVAEGRGLSFFFRTRTTTISSIPANTLEMDFVFNEITANFQAVTVQGLVTYRIADPRKVASLLNFTVDPVTKRPRTTDPAKMAGRLVNLVQESTRAEIQQLALEDVLRARVDLARAILRRVQADAEAAVLGVEVANVFLTAVRPTPEVAKALEAGYRETLLKRADQAIYDRRATAVEQERKIRENELETDITLEREREALVQLRVANAAKEAEAEATAIEARIGPWRTMDPRVVMALALKGLGDNAAKIGTLMITPDLLSQVFKDAARASDGS